MEIVIWCRILKVHFWVVIEECCTPQMYSSWNSESMKSHVKKKCILLILQNWPPQHQRWQLGVPFSGWSELLGQTGPSHFQAETLHDSPRMVEWRWREELAKTIAQDGDGGVWEGWKAAQTQSWTVVHRRVPGDDTQPEQAERVPVETCAAVQRELPTRLVWKITFLLRGKTSWSLVDK